MITTEAWTSEKLWIVDAPQSTELSTLQNMFYLKKEFTYKHTYTQMGTKHKTLGRSFSVERMNGSA